MGGGGGGGGGGEGEGEGGGEGEVMALAARLYGCAGVHEKQCHCVLWDGRHCIQQ